MEPSIFTILVRLFSKIIAMKEDCHVIKVDNYDIGNGPGIRVTVWVAGCSHHCEGCHNPDTWKWNQGKPLTDEIVGKILEACDKPYIQGLSISGGDPFFIKNREGVAYLCKCFREKFGESKTIWLWTGYLFEDIKDLECINYLNVVVDGKFDISKKDPRLKYAGSSNQRVISIVEV